MKNLKFKDLKGKMLFMGIDVHKKSWTISIRTFEESQGTTKIKGLEDLIEVLHAVPTSSWKIVYEAGFSGFWLQRELRRRGFDCIVTSPSLVPVRAGSKVKTDKIDSQRLAECLAAGQLRSVYIPSEREEARRELIRQREQFVEDRVRAKNRIKSFLMLHNIDLGSNSSGIWGKQIRERIKGTDLGWPELNRTLLGYFKMLGEVEKLVEDLTKEIAELSKSKDFAKNATLLRSIPGVGPLTSMAILLELGDLKRFKNSRQLAAYVGLTPSQYSSGEKVYMGRITRSGKALVRKMLVEAVWVAINICPPLQLKYNEIADRRGKKRASVAMARRLLIMCRRILLDQRAFNPERLKAA